jgi:hypothetical protein
MRAFRGDRDKNMLDAGNSKISIVAKRQPGDTSPQCDKLVS